MTVARASLYTLFGAKRCDTLRLTFETATQTTTTAAADSKTTHAFK